MVRAIDAGCPCRRQPTSERSQPAMSARTACCSGKTSAPRRQQLGTHETAAAPSSKKSKRSVDRSAKVSPRSQIGNCAYFARQKRVPIVNHAQASIPMENAAGASCLVQNMSAVPRGLTAAATAMTFAQQV